MTGEPSEDATGKLPETQRLHTQDGSGADPRRGAADLPQRLGRYVVRGKLGQGGFADVFLAHDEELDRQVALKVPRANQFGSEEELRTFVEEARTSARLQHPGIVNVFDVGSYEGTPFIVLEYIRGRPLAKLLKDGSISYRAAAQLMVEIAEAIAHAHERGFVHRDIKPQNILLDAEDHPHVADFGLAVKHWELAELGDRVAGTTPYMAPEQVRGETHRIDARTDIWALGVVFYRMLTRRLPFVGSTRREVFQQILYSDPVPPRQALESIPTELERICLRCLSRQMSDRYRRATDLAADLAEWLCLAAAESGSSAGRRAGFIEPPQAPLVPRGLRSFEREDGEFFLRLIPGPRDRDGLPGAIRFWKSRLEERDSEETFTVGVLYGPSGCGKSSLVQAGILPRLDADVISLHLDATSRETEPRLLRALRKTCRQALPGAGLDDALRQLRESPKLRGGKKLVIVLDQFEQWLNTWQSGPDAELVRALRQCDGGAVQAILMVRDDFWIPLSRLMRDLEVGIVEGMNGMLVDSFDPEHARRVLRELGVAYGRLPASALAQSAEQAAFLEQAVSGLTEENRLYPIRLAVFVEMVKDRPWTPATLDEMGGAEGVGLAFLDASVGTRASPARRIHEPAIRRILAALLPPAGQIKGRVRTRSELLEASRYQARPYDFDAVIRTLDVELRLITPAQALDEESSNAASGDQGTAQEAVYQLTHDFLVPSIREWLERQTRGSPKGRAQLLLQEQAGIWNSRPSPRYLPSLTEWIGIWRQTSRREWTEPQSRMMRAAARRILRGALTVTLLLAAGLVSALLIYNQLDRRRGANEAQRLVSKLQDVDIADVPDVVDEMRPYRFWTDSALQTVFGNQSETAKRRARAAMALLATDPAPVPWLAEQLMDEQTPPNDWLMIRDALLPHREAAIELLRAGLAAPANSPPVRFRIACALAGLDDDAEFWDERGAEVAASFLREPAADARAWIPALRPVGRELRAPLIAALAEIESSEPARSLEIARVGALALFEWSGERADDLLEVLVDADGPRYRAVMELLGRNPASSLEAVRSRHAQLSALESPGAEGDRQARQSANLILALWELGDPHPLRESSVLRPDPRLRTRLIHGMTPDRIGLNKILPLIMESEVDDPALNVALMAASFHLNEPTSAEVKRRLRSRLREIYRSAPDPEAHSVSGLLLRRLGDDGLAEADRELANLGPEPTRRWFATKSGLTMIVLELSEADSGGERSSGASQPVRRFAIASTEAPLDLYKQFDATHLQDGELREASDRTPATELLGRQMAGFCNWLSQRDGIDPDQWCYPPAEELNVANCHPLPNAMQKRGYRLPSAAEWELACGCGAAAPRFYGDAPALLHYYAWEQANSERLLRKVGELLPNPLGLFDVYGNAEEICIAGLESWSPPAAPAYVGKGGSSLISGDGISTKAAKKADYTQRSKFEGVRVVRSLPLGDG